jgi:hypothetical protein
MKYHSTNLLGFTPTLDGQSAQTSIRPIESAPPPDLGPYPGLGVPGVHRV